jgi:hypothetical protein
MLFRIAILAGIALSLSAQEAAKPSTEVQGMLPPRVAPTDYQANAKTGNFTIAAEFARHGIPTPDGALTTENFVVVEAAIFGPPDSKLAISYRDFALRINGKKTPTDSVSFAQVGDSVKDPEWAPPVPHDKPKTSIGGGGAGGDDGPPAPVKVPFGVQRALVLRVKKIAMAEGERPLPQAGLLFFPYGGKDKSIHSVELIYSGPAGPVTFALQP